MKKLLEYWKYAGLLALTLGLAPFSPEPHIWGKINWILGGAKGMKAMDWFDFFLHGSPWIVFIVLSILIVLKKLQGSRQ